MNPHECASYDIHYIQAHYTPYFEDLVILDDARDVVRFQVRPRGCSRACEVTLSRTCYEIVTDTVSMSARSLVGFKCETFESLLAEIMGPSKWQELIGTMLTRKLHNLQSSG